MRNLTALLTCILTLFPATARAAVNCQVEWVEGTAPYFSLVCVRQPQTAQIAIFAVKRSLFRSTPQNYKPGQMILYVFRNRSSPGNSDVAAIFSDDGDVERFRGQFNIRQIDTVRGNLILAGNSRSPSLVIHLADAKEKSLLRRCAASGNVKPEAEVVIYPKHKWIAIRWKPARRSGESANSLRDELSDVVRYYGFRYR